MQRLEVGRRVGLAVFVPVVQHLVLPCDHIPWLYLAEPLFFEIR